VESEKKGIQNAAATAGFKLTFHILKGGSGKKTKKRGENYLRNPVSKRMLLKNEGGLDSV